MPKIADPPPRREINHLAGAPALRRLASLAVLQRDSHFLVNPGTVTLRLIVTTIELPYPSFPAEWPR